MKNLNVKHLIIVSVLAYALGVSAFLGSFFVPILSDAELQANIVLAIAIIPAAILGARVYYRKGHQTNSFLLGGSMFFITIILDALITVPLFVIPTGGDHISFFTDPGFWFIGMEYVLAVVTYRWMYNKSNSTIASQY